MATRSLTLPILSDGTTIDDLIDVQRREVSLRVLSDPEIHELELQRLFAKAWIVVGHETEIPNAGDFVMRYVGTDSVIVARGTDGAVNVMLNVCTHRGMHVCRLEKGNRNGFQCPYHAWAYDLTGRFLGAPYQKEMYGDVLDRQQLGLRRARSALCGGIIFATFADDAPSLEEYLGDISWYLQAMYERTDKGMEVLGPPQRFVVDANWKTAAEQAAGDGYHTIGLHRSLLELGFLVEGPDGTPTSLYGVDVGSPQGHGLRCVDLREGFALFARQGGDKDLTSLTKLELMPPCGMTKEMVVELPNNLDDQQIACLASFPPAAGGLFPNVLVTNFFGISGEGMLPTTSFHAYVPKSPGTFEFWNWILVEKDASPELRHAVAKGSALNLGAAGLVEQDDAEAWPEMQHAASGALGREQKMRYPALLGETPSDAFNGPGLVYAGFTKDDNQWNWWLRYRDFLTGSPW